MGVGLVNVRSYRDLKVWQLGMEVAKEVYVLTRGFPRHEVYGLSSQVQRSAVSVPSNIAEGHAKESTKDYLRHLSIASGSLAELEIQLTLAESLGYCTQDQASHLLGKCEQETRMLHSLKSRLKAKIAP